MNETEKKEKVCKILKTPIVCENRNDGIRFDSNDKVIKTGQTYYRGLDEDMSDFSIGFYEIVYLDIVKKIPQGHILKSDGTLANCCFAGDTMNSFHSIANLVPEAGKSKKTRTPKEEWTTDLQKYHHRYRCLANFWILPFCIGRTGKKINYYDSMDIFLEEIKSDYKILEKHSSYFDAIPKFSDFEEIHCISKYIKKYNINGNALSMYKNKQAKELIVRALNMIDERAEEISEKYCEELWNYFDEWKLIEESTFFD